MRVRLSTDMGCCLDESTGLKVWLDDSASCTADPVTIEEALVAVGPVLTVRLRERIGYDERGDPEFVWTTVVESAAVVWQERKEIDDIAGVTHVRATATVPYTGTTKVPESAIVLSDVYGPWRIVGANQFEDRIEFDLERIESAG